MLSRAIVFEGRAAELETAAGILQQTGSLVLQGESGMGKSLFMAKLTAKLRAEERSVGERTFMRSVVAAAFIGATGEDSASPLSILLSLCEQLQGSLHPGNSQQHREWPVRLVELSASLGGLLQEAVESGRTVTILLDALNQLTTEPGVGP